MNKLLDFYNNHKVWIWIVATIVTVVPFVVCFFGPMYFVDSAYYIAIAERISEGNTLYTDVCCGYSPIWFYIEAAFRRLFGVPLGCYWPYLILYYVFFACTAILLYKLIMQYTNNKLIAIFCAWLFLPLTYWQQAYSVMLEIPSVFFGLLACYGIVISKNRSCWNYLWIGAIACCAFLTKQFGIGFIAINLFQLLFIDRRDYKSIGLYLLGYCVPILLCWVIWKQDFWVSILGNGYGTKSASEAGQDITLWYKSTNMLFHILRFCEDACVAVFAGLCIAPYSKQQKRLPYYLLAILGMLGFSLQFYFAGGRHYRVYLIPFAMILIAEMLVVQTPKWLTWAKYVTLIVTIIASLYNSHIMMVLGRKDYPPQAIRQHTEVIKKYVPDGDILWPSQAHYFALTFTTKTIMPNLSTIGYSFGPLGLNQEKAMQQARAAQWIVHDLTKLHEPYYVTDSLNDYICQFPSVPLDKEGSLRLFKMSKEEIKPIVQP